MPVVSFVRQSNRSEDAIQANPSRLLNLYPEPTGQGGRTGFVLQPCHGMQQLQTLDGVFALDMQEIDGVAYVLMPRGFHRVQTGVSGLLAPVQNGMQGNISRNLDTVTACIGGTYYVWDGSSMSEPTTGAVSNVAWVEYIAGRSVVGELGTGKFGWSEIADPTTFDGLNFAVAEAREDETIRGRVTGNYLYLMGAKTTEIWAPSGSGANAFSPTGAVLGIGLKSFYLVARVDDALFVVGADNVAYMMAGNEKAAVSTPAVTAAIQNNDPRSCIYWEERGHKFIAIVFADRPAWVYDLATKEWWERCESPRAEAWRARAAAKLGNDWLVAGDDGRVYTLARSSEDAGDVLYREAISYTLGDGGEWFTLAELQMNFSNGYETATVQIQLGDGVTWGQEIMRDLPAVGNFTGRTVFRALGRHRRLSVRFSMTGAPLAIDGDCRVRLA